MSKRCHAIEQMKRNRLTKVDMEFSILPVILMNAPTSSSSDISSDIRGPRKAAAPMGGSGAVFVLFTDPLLVRAFWLGDVVKDAGDVGRNIGT